MKTQNLTRPALEASLSKYSVIQKINMVIAIFSDIFKGSHPDELNQITIFTAQYTSFRLSAPIIPNVSTYVGPFPEFRPPTPLYSPFAPKGFSKPLNYSVRLCIIQPSFYTIPFLLI